MRAPVLFAIALAAGCKGGDTAPVEINTPPIADAGSNVNQPADRTVNLDGRASYDADAGDVLRYHWSFDSVPEGSALKDREAPFSANADTSGVTSFQPDRVGVYIVKLVVDDGTATSDPDYVVVTTSEPEQVPVANAGPDITVELGASATVNGGGSYDPLGGSLTYTWTLVDVPYNSTVGQDDLTGADAVSASFTPDRIGDYTLTLVVGNGMSTSAADSVEVHVTGDNDGPTAVAGDDQTGSDCTTIELDCTGSTDPNDDELKYFWELQSKPSSSTATNSNFGDREEGATTFWPDQAGTYVVSCSVFDGTTWSAPDFVTLTLAERATNSAPLVDAGDDRVEAAGDAECVLDGYTYDCDDCASLSLDVGTDGSITDPDGDPMVIEWIVADGDATIKDAEQFPTTVNLGSTTPEEPGACTNTDFTFMVVATDCPGATANDSVTISAECCGVEGT